MNEDQHDEWDPRDASILKDQRTAYDEMRERCPVARSTFLGWSLFCHDDINAVLADPETFSNASQFLSIPNGMDPPDHGPYYDVLAAFFDDEHMAQFEPRAREIAATLLEPMHGVIEMEFIDEFATPYALRALCAFLGWPEQQWTCLAGWVHGNQQAALTEDSVAGKALADVFAEHVRTNLHKHRASQNDEEDATDALMSAEANGEKFSDEQIVSMLRNWAAGHGTVAAGLGILVLHLAQDCELQDRLRNNPSLIPSAIEEILRIDDPLVANRRTTTREVEIQGRTIPEGEHLTLMWIAANRDPRRFEDADVVKIDRSTDDGLVWGQGIHLCLGAPLARLEMRVALEALLARTRRVRLAEEAPRRAVYPSNGLAALPLRLS
ncbi:cytochrome P450 [Aquisalimonas sp.]|uniref:cytochrome P450 n=1 Tax=Aquisalimonas sp. TaxID=1872621 RepID=UPI0025C5B744|nr:cytochrome P450 [Aquisalimonas sp.]